MSPTRTFRGRAAFAAFLAGAAVAMTSIFAQNEVGTAASRAPAPDDSERVRELEAEVAALRRQVHDLQAQLDRLRGTDAEVSTDAAPLDPYASPGSLLLELRRRYARQLGDLARSTPSQQAHFESQAERWCEKVRGEIRGRTRWLAVVTDVRVPERGEPDALFRVLDEFTQRPLGEAVRLPIDRTAAGRFESLRRGHELRYNHVYPDEAPGLAYSISTVVLAEPVFDRERLDAGVFNYPPIVGPCVEFGMRLDIDSVSAVELDPSAPGSTPGPTVREAPARPAR